MRCAHVATVLTDCRVRLLNGKVAIWQISFCRPFLDGVLLHLVQVFSLAAECAYTGSHDVALEDCLDLWALATSLQVWPAFASH